MVPIPELPFSCCFAAKPLGGPEEELHQAVLQHGGGLGEGAEGDLSCCEEKQGAGPGE